MSKLNTSQKAELEQKFGNRVTFDHRERKMYSHDIAAMPSLVKPLVGSTIPDCVVQPESEKELVDLVQWAVKNRVPLTPRGKATSGYGGVLPLKGGLVVDFFRMGGVLDVDSRAGTVRVQPGIVWEKLDRELGKKGFTLRLYPSSSPSSTVGGWLAQGGVGFGSYEFGWIRENVISARVVLPDGTVRTLKEEDLDLVADAEGITGFITEVVVKVQPKEDLGLIAIGCPDPHALQKVIQSFVDEKLPIWSLMFINPRMAELKNRAPLREHHGHPVEERVLLPASYIVTLTFREKDRAALMGKLPQLLKPCEAEILSDKIAHHEWEHRFNLMVVKRLGPSLVPAEVVVPLSSFGDAMQEIEKKINQPVVKEGVVIRKGKDGKPEIVILGFIPSDQRKFSYNFIFPLVLTIIKIAERVGGRPYSTGMYFAGKADEIIGEAAVTRLKAFKSEVDPHDILNPGKVIRSGLVGTALAIGGIMEPFIRPLGNHVMTRIGEHPAKQVGNIPAEIGWYAYACSQCGYCVQECDQYYGRGWESQSPRGKWYWLREYMEGREKWDQKQVDTMLVCTTCEMCDTRCSASLPIEPSWMELRGILIQEEKRATFPPFEMMAEALKKEGDIWAGYRKNRFDWFPKDLLEKHGPGKKAPMVYFAGCTACYVEHDIAMGTTRLLDKAGVDFTVVGEKENCCGTPILVAGKWDLFAATMEKNIRAVKETGATTVITSCPACDMMWRKVYPEWAKKRNIDFNVKTKHYSEVVAEKINSGTFKFPGNNLKPMTVTWHDSCHIGRATGVYEAPRDVIKAIPNLKFVEMPYNREEAHCCGSVLTLIKEPLVAHDIGKTRLDEAVEVGAEKVLALCPCCQFQLRVSADKKKSSVGVEDLSSLAARALGYEMPDPHPEVKAQWAVFEGMIALMTPQGFANLMGTMWPELISAMPLGMGPMMRMMGKIPGALTLMKPLFPILFPRLLPLMMPKVLPTMLDRIGGMIPMPAYMKEQMPVLMPKVMDSLMPHMIGDVVPLVTQPMIDYLHGKKAV